MNDRLKELKNYHDNNADNLKATQIDIESQISDNSQIEGLVSKEFQTDIASARVIIEKIKANTEDIQNLKGEYSSATRVAKEKEISQQIDMNLSDNRKYAQQLKRIMDNLKEDIDKTNLDKNKQGDSFVKQNLYHSISTAAKEVLLDSQSAQEDYRQGLKTKTTRQVRHFAPEMTDEQIEQIAEDPDHANQIFQQKMFNTASIQLQNAVQDAQEKYRAILKLEQVQEMNYYYFLFIQEYLSFFILYFLCDCLQFSKSIQELHQLMLDIATMVYVQGELIDNIEINVNMTKVNVEIANKNLTTAKKHHISARKKQCCLLLIVVVIVSIILAFTLK